MPLYVLGAAGMARRTQEIFDPAFRPWLLVALGGAFVLLAGARQPVRAALRQHPATATPTACPSATRGTPRPRMVGSAPPPEWNFATIPHVGGRDAFYWRKRNNGAYKPADHYRDIEMPKEPPAASIIGIAAAACGFGLVWRIWWMAACSWSVIWSARSSPAPSCAT